MEPLSLCDTAKTTLCVAIVSFTQLSVLSAIHIRCGALRRRTHVTRVNAFTPDRPTLPYAFHCTTAPDGATVQHRIRCE